MSLSRNNRGNFLRMHCIEPKKKRKKAHESTWFLKMYHIKRKVYFLVPLWILFFLEYSSALFFGNSRLRRIFIFFSVRVETNTLLLSCWDVFSRAFIIIITFWLAIQTSIDLFSTRLRKIINVLTIRDKKFKIFRFNHQ